MFQNCEITLSNNTMVYQDQHEIFIYDQYNVVKCEIKKYFCNIKYFDDSTTHRKNFFLYFSVEWDEFWCFAMILNMMCACVYLQHNYTNGQTFGLVWGILHRKSYNYTTRWDWYKDEEMYQELINFTLFNLQIVPLILHITLYIFFHNTFTNFHLFKILRLLLVIIMVKIFCFFASSSLKWYDSCNGC